MTGRQENLRKKVNGKLWRFENSHCGGQAVSKTPSNKVCPSSFFLRTVSENIKPCNSNLEITNAGALQTASTSSPSMSASLPASSLVSLWSQTTSCSATPPGLFSPISTTTLSSRAHGDWWKFQKELWKNLQLTRYLLEMKWFPHAGSHFSQTFHGRARLDYHSVDLLASYFNYLLIIILVNLSDSNDVTMIFQGTVEDRNWKFPHLKTLLSLTCLNINTLKFYSLLPINFTIHYGNYKDIPSWKGNYGE